MAEDSVIEKKLRREEVSTTNTFVVSTTSERLLKTEFDLQYRSVVGRLKKNEADAVTMQNILDYCKTFHERKHTVQELSFFTCASAGVPDQISLSFSEAEQRVVLNLRFPEAYDPKEARNKGDDLLVHFRDWCKKIQIPANVNVIRSYAGTIHIELLIPFILFSIPYLLYRFNIISLNTRNFFYYCAAGFVTFGGAGAVAGTAAAPGVGTVVGGAIGAAVGTVAGGAAYILGL